MEKDQVGFVLLLPSRAAELVKVRPGVLVIPVPGELREAFKGSKLKRGEVLLLLICFFYP